MTTKESVAFALNVGVMRSPVVWSALTLNGLGHEAVPAVTAQVTLLQLKPGATGSVSRVPGASAGPRLATVMV